MTPESLKQRVEELEAALESVYQDLGENNGNGQVSMATYAKLLKIRSSYPAPAECCCETKGNEEIAKSCLKIAGYYEAAELVRAIKEALDAKDAEKEELRYEIKQRVENYGNLLDSKFALEKELAALKAENERLQNDNAAYASTKVIMHNEIYFLKREVDDLKAAQVNPGLEALKEIYAIFKRDGNHRADLYEVGRIAKEAIESAPAPVNPGLKEAVAVIDAVRKYNEMYLSNAAKMGGLSLEAEAIISALKAYDEAKALTRRGDSQ